MTKTWPDPEANARGLAAFEARRLAEADCAVLGCSVPRPDGQSIYWRCVVHGGPADAKEALAG